jgi:hypothetical protein
MVRKSPPMPPFIKERFERFKYFLPLTGKECRWNTGIRKAMFFIGRWPINIL